ncbi:hypothetical protein [Vibrio mexicanus]|uniref:hypothetical protein n=1 Tax=Vibrio mexicanus TaxID=1004326 RepID=UPI00069B9AF8|nr:hypothetical protein [Vibrio mexicanus]
MNRGSKGLFTKYGQPFSRWWEAIRAEVLVIPMKDPLDPIMSVKSDIMTLRTGYHTRRNVALIPMMLTLTFFAFLQSTNVPWPNLSAEQKIAERRLEWLAEAKTINAKRGYNNYPGINIEQREVYYQTLLGASGKVTLVSYLKAKSIEGRLNGILISLAFTIFLSSVAIALWLIVLLKPRDAEIYFDRKRQIVYSWRRGRVGAAHFDKVGIKQSHNGSISTFSSKTLKKRAVIGQCL